MTPLTDAQSELVVRWHPYAMTIANRRAKRFSREPDRLERYRDAATFQLVRAAATFKGINSSSFENYLASCVHLALRGVDRIHFKRHIKTSSIENLKYSLPAPVVVHEPEFQLESMVASLKPRQRDVVTLHYLEGVPIAEIAGRMGLTTSGAESIRTRAVRLLRAKLFRQINAA